MVVVGRIVATSVVVDWWIKTDSTTIVVVGNPRRVCSGTT
jgi:hypothetical protein